MMYFTGVYILLTVFALTNGFGGSDENVGGIEGRVCAFGDMNKDRYTDMIVQVDNFLKINVQSEEGKFTESTQHQKINIGLSSPVSCIVADFDGDSTPDILISYQSSSVDSAYEVAVIVLRHQAHMKIVLEETFYDHPSVMDVNGDGISDIVGFSLPDANDKSNISFVCHAGMKSPTAFNISDCSDIFEGMNKMKPLKPILGFPPIFADLNGDLSSEIIFGMEDKEHIVRLDVWQLNGVKQWNYSNQSIVKPIRETPGYNHFGAAIVGDIDGDGLMDILIPVCREEKCIHVDSLLCWTRDHGWNRMGIDLKDNELSPEAGSKVLFRIGDFTLDGFPDLIAAVKSNNKDKVHPMILENVPVADVENVTRKFDLRGGQRLVEPGSVALGEITMVSFFDLKEDGSLDILVEYKYDSKVKHEFIRCEDKGDTTFLKVQIYTSVCANECPRDNEKDIGSGIAWHGACVHFAMADSWGDKRVSVQCQMPQTSHRSLPTPYALFGLGRSPNFVDMIRIGSPRWPNGGTVQAHFQRTELKQIVPNSRLIVVPPETTEGYWISRLYVTPSRLIIQSLLVLISVCILLILLVGYLHFRERKEDRKERQMQSHRFHFDAL
ncbi:hypothetical protein L596_024148 [Steinernema carpocapsae]|uniref:T-cell immunomodulatory protein TIP C2 domain-containing protein n=1 Tax=Steinernema carpocapsae TaxID=34508 RepID=A0A4U5MFV5_STECR|nr:hypothetical protein L596_024148 [Steinernema carpocapsae]